MKTFIKVVAGIAIGASCISMALGCLYLLASSSVMNAFIISAALLGSGLVVLLFGGMAWVLVEIAEKLPPRESKP